MLTTNKLWHESRNVFITLPELNLTKLEMYLAMYLPSRQANHKHKKMSNFILTASFQYKSPNLPPKKTLNN